MLKIKIPNYIAEVIIRLEARGFEAYVVGGAVRDALLGMTPYDWDIATDALPNEIMETFPQHYATGLKHGTVTIIIDGYPVEATTYRKEGKYQNLRRPEKFIFTKKLFDDLMRRDFSINALAYNPRFGIIDAYGGLEDLQNRIIRCVGNPSDRLSEDALRILRAIRFAVTLDFRLDGLVFEAINKNARLLENISGERICSELTRLIMADRRLELLFDSGVGDVILPEVACCFSVWQNSPSQIYDVGNHLLETVVNSPKSPLLRFAALLHDIGKSKTKRSDYFGGDSFPGHALVSVNLSKAILDRLKLSNKAKKTILDLIRLHNIRIRPTVLSVKRVAAKLGKAELGDLIALKRANSLSHSIKHMQLELNELDRVEAIYNDILEKNTPLYIRDLAISGNDLKEIGLSGSQIGNMLRYLMVRVVEKEELNTREALLNLALCKEKERTEK